MKIKYMLLLIAIGILALGFRTSPQVAELDLQGTWQLSLEKIGENGDLVVPVSGNTKKKLITGKHFTWFEYDRDGKLVGLGGGTYTIKGNTYVETIEYYYPKGSSLLGASIPFDCHIQDGKWHHSGFIQYREIDGETGEYKVTNTEKLSEIWVRTK